MLVCDNWSIIWPTSIEKKIISTLFILYTFNGWWANFDWTVHDKHVSHTYVRLITR